MELQQGDIRGDEEKSGRSCILITFLTVVLPWVIRAQTAGATVNPRLTRGQPTVRYQTPAGRQADFRNARCIVLDKLPW